MDYNDKERLKSVLSQELMYIARQAVSSDKTRIEDEVTKWFIKDMTAKGQTYRHGMPKSELVKIICDSNINKFAQIVDGAKSQDKFIQDVTDLLPMAYRRMSWRKIERAFGIHWKFHFDFPKNLYDKKVNARTYSKRKSKTPEPKVPPFDPMTLIPENIRELCQKMTGMSDVQKKVINSILDNPITPAVRGIRIQVEKNIWVSIQID